MDPNTPIEPAAVPEPTETPAAAEPVVASLTEFVPPPDTFAAEPAPATEPEVPSPAPVPAVPATAVAPAEPDVLGDDELPSLEPPAPDPQELARRLADIEQRFASGAPAPTQPTAPEQPAPPAQDEVFVTDEQFETILADPGSFNRFLGEFKRHTQVQTVMAAQELMMPQVVQTATRMALEAVDYSNTVREFYQKNPELLEHRGYAEKVYNAIYAKHPEWDIPQLLAATRRETLRGLQRAGRIQPTQPGPARTSPGPVAPPTGARPAMPSRNGLNGLAAELAEIRL